MSMTLDIDLELAAAGRDWQARCAIPLTGVTAVVGPSGSGKTTLLRCIAGLEPAARGRLRLGDQVWQDGGYRMPAHRRRIGYVFQEAALLPHLDVLGNCRFAWRRALPDRRHDPAAVLELVGAAGLAGRRITGLSGGERQRVAIARALVGGPELVLLDEPVAALDVEAAAVVLDVLAELRRRLAVPMIHVTHRRDEVARVADQVLEIHAGRVGRLRPVQEALADPADPADCAVLFGQPAGWSAEDRLLAVQVGDQQLLVPATAAVRAAGLRLAVRSRDVSLCRSVPAGSSILNILPVTVIEVVDDGGPTVRVVVHLAGQPLVARISRRSQRQLGIAVGQPWFAQIKAVSLLG